jgi:hypothetical protein
LIRHSSERRFAPESLKARCATIFCAAARSLTAKQGASEVVLILASWKTWSPTDKGVWSGWIAIITVFWLLFGALAFIFGISAIDSHRAWRDFPPLEHIFIADTIFVAFLPGLAGVAQWLLLRTYIQRRSWWVPLWVLATIIGWTGVLVLALRPPPDLPLWSTWIIGGAINSLLQGPSSDHICPKPVGGHSLSWEQ